MCCRERTFKKGHSGMNAYFEQMILSASPVELVRLMDGQAIVSVQDAREHLRQKKVAARSRAIMRGYGILAELLTALRVEDAPQFAPRLRSLYLYMQGLLLKANCDQIDEPLAETLALLHTLAEAWKQVPDLHAGQAAAIAA